MFDSDRTLQFVTLGGIALLAVAFAAAVQPAAAASATLDDPVTVHNATDQQITGTTTLDPGATVSVRVQSTGDTQPRFIWTEDAQVNESGGFSAAFDFSNHSIGDTFEVTVVKGNETLATADGEVSAAPETTRTGIELPGFGVAPALAAVALAAGAALLRR